MVGNVIGMINSNGSKNVELIFSVLRLLTDKLTAVEKISSKLKMNLSDAVSQFKLSFAELQLTELVLFKISEGLSKLTPLLEFTQVFELMQFSKRDSFNFPFRQSYLASAKHDFETL